MILGSREADSFREVAALYSDHLKQVPLCIPVVIKVGHFAWHCLYKQTV